MSIINKHYELSVLESIQDVNGYKEHKICTLGTDGDQSLFSAKSIKLDSKVNGEKKLTFSLYYSMIDNATGERIDNPYCYYLFNERKVHLDYNEQTYDFIIKDIKKDSKAKTYTYIAEDAIKCELVKNGYDIVLNPFIKNNKGEYSNTGSIKELADRVFENTDWTIKAEPLIEKVSEQLLKITFNSNITIEDAILLKEQNGKIVQFIQPDLTKISAIYAFYSSCNNKPDRFSFVIDKPIKKDANHHYIITEQYYIEPTQYYKNSDYFLPWPLTDITTINFYSPAILAYRYGFSADQVFEPTINRYVYKYVKRDATNESVDSLIYGYQDYSGGGTEVIVNGSFANTDGWSTMGSLATPVSLEVPIDYKKIDPPTSQDMKAKIAICNSPYGIKSFIMNESFKAHKKTVPQLIKGMKFDCSFVCDSQDVFMSIGYLENPKDYATLHFLADGCSAPGNQMSKVLVLTETCPIDKEPFVFFYASKSGTKIDAWLSQVSVREIDNSDNPIVYKYYTKSTDGILNYTNLTYQTPLDTYKKSYRFIDGNNCEKIRSVEIKESNYFNIVTTLCNKFECWADFEVNIQENGTVSKTISFKPYVGQENQAGFKYGVNLNGITRTTDSRNIITKLIVRQNSNQFAPHGHCNIRYASGNETGEDYIYNFDHYINKGMLTQQFLDEQLYTGNKAFYPIFKQINEQMRPAQESNEKIRMQLVKLGSEKTLAETSINAAQEKIDEEKKYLKQISGLAYEYFESASDEIKKNETYINILTIIRENDRLKTVNNIKLNEINSKISALEQTMENNNHIIQEQLKNKQIYIKNFYKVFAPYIQEGTWIDESYRSYDLYFEDALKTLSLSCLPKVSYDIKVLALDQLDDYKYYNYKVGDKTFVEDPEFFGVDETGKPIRKDIIVTETSENLMDPSKNSIKVQTYKNEFDDLFEQITATVAQAQYTEGAYNKAANLADGTDKEKFSFLDDALKDAEAQLALAGEQSVEWGKDGIIVTDANTPSNRIKIVGGAIMMSGLNDQQQPVWKTALTSKGISASIITAGRIDTREIQIMNGNDPCFFWDVYGINAINKVKEISEDKYKGAVRFDKYGVYGFQKDPRAYHPDSIKSIQDNSIFSLTWEGFTLKGAGSKVSIDSDTGIQLDNKTETGTSTIILGKYKDTNSDKYGLCITSNQQKVLYLDDDGNLNMTGKLEGASSISLVNNDSTFLHADNKCFRIEAGNKWMKFDDTGLTLNGNITWSNGASPAQGLYTSQKNPLKPAGLFSTFPDTSIDGWHKTPSENDIYYANTFDGGQNWSEPLIYKGQPGQPGKDGADGTITEIEYYTSETYLQLDKVPSEKGWSTTKLRGNFVYQRSATTKPDGEKTYNAPQLIQAFYKDSRGQPKIVTDTDYLNFVQLTNNGLSQGLYYDPDGQSSKLYINADYINTGALTIKENERIIFLADATENKVSIGGWQVDETGLSCGLEGKETHLGTGSIALGTNGTNGRYAFQLTSSGEITITANSSSYDNNNVTLKMDKQQLHIFNTVTEEGEKKVGTRIWNDITNSNPKSHFESKGIITQDTGYSFSIEDGLVTFSIRSIPANPTLFKVQIQGITYYAKAQDIDGIGKIIVLSEHKN